MEIASRLATLYNLLYHNFYISGINGVLALKDEAYRRGWLVVAHEHFEPVPDPSTLDVSRQLKWIRQTGTRIIVLNCYKKYSRQVRWMSNKKYFKLFEQGSCEFCRNLCITQESISCYFPLSALTIFLICQIQPTMERGIQKHIL